MSVYLASVGKVHLALDRFRNVNKTLLLAGLSGLAAFIGSVVGYIVNPFPTPGALHVAVWDTWIGLGIGLTVAIVQNWHLARLEVAGKDLLKAATISMAGGLFGGVALIAVKTILGIPFGLSGNLLIPHVAGWTAESLVMALAVSRAIPNLKVRSALLSGAAAGLLGGAVTGLGVLPVAVGNAFKGVFIALAPAHG
jgi:hypothetical protein